MKVFFNIQTAAFKFVWYLKLTVVLSFSSENGVVFQRFLTSRDCYDIIYSIYSHECSRFIMFIEGQEKPTFPGRRESMFPSHECPLGLNEEFSRHISLKVMILSDRLSCK